MRVLLAGLLLASAAFAAADGCKLTQYADSSEGWAILVCAPDSKSPNGYIEQQSGQAVRRIANTSESSLISVSANGSAAAVSHAMSHARTRLIILSRDGIRDQFLIAGSGQGVWDGKGERYFFHYSSTVEADAWNVLGAYDTRTRKVAVHTLHGMTESLDFCAAKQSITTESWMFNSGEAGLRFADEYDLNGKYLRSRTLPGGRFSASCKFATEFVSAHGPIRTHIYDSKTGETLWSLPTTSDDSVWSSVVEWNPHYDNWALIQESGALKLYDVGRKRVTDLNTSWQTYTHFSNDGRALLQVTDKGLQRTPLRELAPEFPN